MPRRASAWLLAWLVVGVAPLQGAPQKATAQAGPDGSAELRFIAIGGGATPESTEISLEQNLALIGRVLAGPGALYFAGGRGSRSVRVEVARAERESLLVRIGDLFNPRHGRRSVYRVSQLSADAASLAAVEAGLADALGRGRDPLLLFVSAHGEQGEHPHGNAFLTWGGQALDVARLAELHEQRPRPMRVIAASCYSGGFAELAFKAADPKLGATVAPRCGLFAGTWDRQTSGCDPNPDRRAQEGYTLHLLEALRGRDRDGRPMPRERLDADRDGRVSLLEAHAWASVAGQSIDVPTTTSERYLRAVQPAGAGTGSGRGLLAEYDAVIATLGAALKLPSARAASARVAALRTELDVLAERFDDIDRELQGHHAAFAGRLLARWPELDDAYHPAFAPLLASEEAQISEAFAQWPEAHAYFAVQKAQHDLAEVQQGLERDEALVTRLVRAQETVALASALRARGGTRWAQYQKLLACERYVPVVAP